MKTIFKLLKIDGLKPHEQIQFDHLHKLKKEILEDGFLEKPIIVDINTKVILDGHHRFNIIRELGLKLISIWLINYQSEEVQVIAWKKGENVTKEDVLRAGLTGKLLKPKTSRHKLKIRRIKKVLLKKLNK